MHAIIICKNNTVFAKSDFWSKTRQPAPVSPIYDMGYIFIAGANFIKFAYVVINNVYYVISRNVMFNTIHKSLLFAICRGEDPISYQFLNRTLRVTPPWYAILMRFYYFR